MPWARGRRRWRARLGPHWPRRPTLLNSGAPQVAVVPSLGPYMPQGGQGDRRHLEVWGAFCDGDGDVGDYGNHSTKEDLNSLTLEGIWT